MQLKIIKPIIFSSPVPYDDNYIALKSPLFRDPPETNYVNASTIKFPGIEQTFIASQAPQPESFAHFWQMVVEEEVEVSMLVVAMIIVGLIIIVMIIVTLMFR